MKRTAIASLGLIGCATFAGDPVVVRSADEVPRRCERVDCEAYRCTDDAPEAARRVPLVALLANPDDYEGCLIEVTAWAAVEYELAALFLKPEDKSHLAFESAIALAGPESMYSTLELPFGGYLRVVGRFSGASHRNLFGGQIGVHRLGKAYVPNRGLTCEEPPGTEPNP